MVHALALALPLALAAVLTAGAIGKIRAPDNVTGWAALGVPQLFRHTWLIRLHPWLELILAGALVALGGILGTIAASAAAVLMAAYLIIVVAAFRTSPEASCACFGTSRRITRVTIVRNAWLTGLAVVTTLVISAGSLWGGALAAAVTNWESSMALIVVAVTAALALWHGALESPAIYQSEPVHGTLIGEGPNGEEYVRVRTPAVPITLGDGTTTHLRDLAYRRPQLLLAVAETCNACQPVVGRLEIWRHRVPEVDIRLLVTVRPNKSRLTSTQPPLTVHDPHGYVRASISEWSTPSAVLLGVDGMLAGGPVSGHPAIEGFIEEIRTSLDEAAIEDA
ncbi:MauE/DoxX family redox-associated membrane protein [Microbacterium sp. LWO12-1.2]|uniref:MauE/DoxX family redox-associated membrane protein n=1 Tax=Microbacterium sp. LWO12-1.2 TaxID=3135261 RepID=UPI003423AC04